MTCTERKIRMSGEVVTYRCDLLALDQDYGVLKYVVGERRTIATVTLVPGTLTFAVYWPDRNYNLYYWTSPEEMPAGTATGPAANGDVGPARPIAAADAAADSEQVALGARTEPPIAAGGASAPRLRPIGYYFNIVDSVSLTPLCFTYRDLVVDLFVAPGGEPVVLDEEELPRDIDPALRSFIEAIKRQLLRDHLRIIEEADRLLAPLIAAA